MADATESTVTSDQIEVYQSFGEAGLERMRQGALERASQSYEQLLNRLWASNAAGVLATFTAVSQSVVDRNTGIYALYSFAAGLAVLGVGAMLNLAHLATTARRLEDTESLLHLEARDIRPPSEAANLTWASSRTVSAVLALGAFVVGVAVGLAAFLMHLDVTP